MSLTSKGKGTRSHCARRPMERGLVGLAVVAGLAFLPATANAQGGTTSAPEFTPPASFSEMVSRVRRGSTVFVTNNDGLERKGTVVNLSASALEMAIDGQEVSFAPQDVREVRRVDSLMSGMLLGLAIGAGSAGLAAAAGGGRFRTDLGDSCRRGAGRCALIVSGLGALGAALGAGFDAADSGQATLFRSFLPPPLPAARFVELQYLVRRGDRIRVTDGRGQLQTGRVLEASAGSLTIGPAPTGQTAPGRTFAEDSVARVVRADSVRNGVITGLIVGAVSGLAVDLTTSALGGNSVYTAVFGAAGAAIGWGVDGLIEKTIYRRPSATGQDPIVTFSPSFTSGSAEVHASLRF